jgi:hypothetical protein
LRKYLNSDAHVHYTALQDQKQNRVNDYVNIDSSGAPQNSPGDGDNVDTDQNSLKVAARDGFVSVSEREYRRKRQRISVWAAQVRKGYC